jgi:hypothetical protein
VYFGYDQDGGWRYIEGRFQEAVGKAHKRGMREPFCWDRLAFGCASPTLLTAWGQKANFNHEKHEPHEKNLRQQENRRFPPSTTDAQGGSRGFVFLFNHQSTGRFQEAVGKAHKRGMREHTVVYVTEIPMRSATQPTAPWGRPTPIQRVFSSAPPPGR